MCVTGSSCASTFCAASWPELGQSAFIVCSTASSCLAQTVSRSHRRSLPSMTRRPARNVFLSPRRRSPSHTTQGSSRGHRMSPRSKLMSPSCQHRYSTSRSPTPRPRRRQISRSRSPRSQSSDCDRQQPLYAADQRLLLLPCPSQRRGPGLRPEFA